jgi:chromosome segregation ATPase
LDFWRSRSKINSEEEFNIRDTYEKSLSLLALKDTHREEAKVKERVSHLEKMEELRAEHNENLRQKETEIDKLKNIIKEKNRIIDEHDVELEKMRLKFRHNECDLKQKLDEIQFQTQDLRFNNEQFSTHLQLNNKNYEEMIINLKIKEKELKTEVTQLKCIIKKINSKNLNLESEIANLKKKRSLSKKDK